MKVQRLFAKTNLKIQVWRIEKIRILEVIMAFDIKKEYKEFYMPKNKPEIVNVPMIAFIGMLLAISLFCVVIKHQMSFLVIVACLAIALCETIKNR